MGTHHNSDVKLQNPSSGIVYETYTNRSHLCTYAQDNVIYKDELYIFRCPEDKECCGRECCIPGAAGIPLWLLILLLILLGILLVLLAAGIIWLCRRMCRRKPAPLKPAPPITPKPKPPPPLPPKKPFIPSPMEEGYLPPAQPITVQAHTESEFTEEQRPLLTRSKTPDEQQAKMMYYRPFVPSPMEEVVVPAPERSQVEYHDTSEFMKPKKPELSAIEKPESKQANVMYYRPGFDKVAAY